MKYNKLSQFRTFENNSNTHTKRGLVMLDQSMEENNYVAPMTAAANGEILDGNARLKKSIEKFGDKAIVIHHDGKIPIVMVRDDLPDSQNYKAKRIAYYSNRTSELNLEWNINQISKDLDDGFDFSGIFNENELDDIVGEPLLLEDESDILLDKKVSVCPKCGFEFEV